MELGHRTPDAMQPDTGETPKVGELKSEASATAASRSASSTAGAAGVSKSITKRGCELTRRHSGASDGHET